VTPRCCCATGRETYRGGCVVLYMARHDVRHICSVMVRCCCWPRAMGRGGWVKSADAEFFSKRRRQLHVYDAMRVARLYSGWHSGRFLQLSSCERQTAGRTLLTGLGFLMSLSVNSKAVPQQLSPSTDATMSRKNSTRFLHPQRQARCILIKWQNACRTHYSPGQEHSMDFCGCRPFIG
jgi:hypothetical protein